MLVHPCDKVIGNTLGCDLAVLEGIVQAGKRVVFGRITLWIHLGKNLGKFAPNGGKVVAAFRIVPWNSKTLLERLVEFLQHSLFVEAALNAGDDEVFRIANAAVEFAE